MWHSRHREWHSPSKEDHHRNHHYLQLQQLHPSPDHLPLCQWWYTIYQERTRELTFSHWDVQDHWVSRGSCQTSARTTSGSGCGPWQSSLRLSLCYHEEGGSSVRTTFQSHGNQEEVGNQEIRFWNVALYPCSKSVNSGNFRPIFEKYFSVVLWE